MIWDLLEASCFPFANVYRFLNTPPLPEVPEGQSMSIDLHGGFLGAPLRPYYDWAQLVFLQFASVPLLALTALCWTYTVDTAAAAQGYDFSLQGWCTCIVLRDFVLTLTVAGGFDYLLYHSPLCKPGMRAYKFNKDYPSREQLLRDVRWTVCAQLLASLQEVLVVRYWSCSSSSTSSISISTSSISHRETAFFSSEHTTGYLLWICSMFYWRMGHFYASHRAMHPWFPLPCNGNGHGNGSDNGSGKGTSVGADASQTNQAGQSTYWLQRQLRRWDVGRFLFKHVHSHHHKSHNCSAFNGISMTPVESITYFSAALIPMLFVSGCHPVVHLYTKLDLSIGAQVGHSGFDAFGCGSYYHQLHHAHSDCNYGDGALPLDWLFGTFEDGRKYQYKYKKDKAVRAKAKAQ